ncbi:MAG: hypothetical protein GWM90_28345 [Gemmatimonadetes bacterium]|nr:hypothetical protein [Gemmatimonadota bacterium]NIQ58944.1 hypothetical protein [Gemmatimonadota bacterium]NIU79134.1 hypothetical protein [Gammaproteobacteria bacterium]NIX47839.1 hypothetical protein [Gemmatimonadota bacterium]NIY12204.1 hypothetical protein [Gemmatimonadota bacterium]
MSEPLRGVIVAHSDLAAALVAAVQRISGVGPEALVALSNEGLGPGGIRDRLDELVGDHPAVIFSDLKGGSCGMAARQLCGSRPGNGLVTGVNLAVLLDFVMNREMPMAELLERLQERGRAAIEALPARD